VFHKDEETQLNDSRVSRVGGYPSFVLEGKTGEEILWPHYKHRKTFVPLKFLAQILLPSGRLFYVFLGVPDSFLKGVSQSDKPVDWMFTDSANVVYLEGTTPPNWVKMRPLLSDSTLLWAEKSFLFPVDTKNPGEPEWLQGDEKPEEADINIFLCQIKSSIGKLGLDFGDGGTAYLFWDGNSQARMVVQQ